MIGLAGEIWLRATVPFMSRHAPLVFVPDVGLMLSPTTEVRWTNKLDFWTVSHTNDLGFLDRVPPHAERAAQSCHITMIGDSFVEARQVPIADKFHVRLEEIAARDLPTLDVTTSAFGRNSTGQINQLAFYDKFARLLRPKLVVLVFVSNDYFGNSPIWRSILRGWDPDHIPYLSTARTESGGFRLIPPDRDYKRFRLPCPACSQQWKKLLFKSWFFDWLQTKYNLIHHEKLFRTQAKRSHRMELLSRRPAYAPLLSGLWSVPSQRFSPAIGNDSQLFIEALALTAFALDEFKKRAERDGAMLVILASHEMSYFGGGALARLNELAAARRIPVIDQGDYIRRKGGELREAQWLHDGHWNPTGHQWAAEALLEYLKQNQEVCG